MLVSDCLTDNNIVWGQAFGISQHRKDFYHLSHATVQTTNRILQIWHSLSEIIAVEDHSKTNETMLETDIWISVEQ